MSANTLPSHLPKPVPGVFEVSGRALIKAPVDKVWQCLVDFPSYGQWNPFVRQFILCDTSYNPLAIDATPAAGQTGVIKFNLPPDLSKPGKGQLRFAIDVFDHQTHRTRWHPTDYPSWFLHSDRWQVLTEVTLEDGSHATLYETQEMFGGLVTYFMRYFMRSGLLVAFQAFADGLKKHVEETP